MRKDEWPQIHAENAAELLAYVGTRSGLESYRSATITWVITGVRSADYNGVLWARLTPEEAELQVPLLVERFRMEQLPAIWHIDPATLPASLGDQLAGLGCRPLDSRVRMAAPILTATRGMRPLPDLTVERATSVEDLRVWMDVWGEIHSEPRSPREELYASLGLNRFEPLRHYLARLAGRPVGVSQLFLGQRAAGLYEIGVREDYRGLGLGAALAQHPLVEARTLGYELATLSPGVDLVPACEALGFESLSEPSTSYSLWP